MLCIQAPKAPTSSYNHADLETYLRERSFETAEAAQSKDADSLCPSPCKKSEAVCLCPEDTTALL